jgi:hypothetical protein
MRREKAATFGAVDRIELFCDQVFSSVTQAQYSGGPFFPVTWSIFDPQFRFRK